MREALEIALGDPIRYGDRRDRVEILVGNQTASWTSGTGSWLVAPVQRVPSGFYLLSENREGQRRGVEVLRAFLGPAVTLESEALAPHAGGIDAALHQAGLVHVAYLRRNSAPEMFLARIEDAVATLQGKGTANRPVRTSFVDQLRDFRLALLHQDAESVEQTWRGLQQCGQLSAENLRFLEVEKLARLERWRDLRLLPYLAELLRARRPRAVNEALLEMLWWTEVAELAVNRSPAEIYAQADLGARYGAVLNTREVPATSSGRAVIAVVALAVGDMARFELVAAAASGPTERDRLDQLAALAAPPPTPVGTDIRSLFEDGQYGAVVRAFLDGPDPRAADLAVISVLERADTVHAVAVRTVVEQQLAEGLVRQSRHLRQNLQELSDLINNRCRSWDEWGARIGRDEPWEYAAEVLRSQYAEWDELPLVSNAKMTALADNVFSAWLGINREQIIAGLDVLCRAAASAVASAFGASLAEAVLLVLAEQQNLSAPVRESYLHLLGQLLDSGQEQPGYTDLLAQAGEIWRKVAAPVAVNWGIGLVDILLDTPCPDPDSRIALVTEIVGRSRSFGQRLSSRQRSELQVLAADIGLPPAEDEGITDDDPVWKRLDGKVLGIYSLLPRTADALRTRLASLCEPASVEGNADTVATAALRGLARRADYLIVDTWHAAHAATEAIDAVRTRDQQILPQGRGVTGFLQALELYLSASD
ncbi:hypothetical protein G7043_39730 [Lentzea sp. NEAU-D13]|uniref:Uncharacterized protein n=1 Tax=Lentzea alba TaxID=2714351 RepID=A0A7C9S0W3_9PSEU|nr:protein DpdD [Lentzea alba]NGY65062.1 hypothetical protein [Lentzea alba]